MRALPCCCCCCAAATAVAATAPNKKYIYIMDAEPRRPKPSLLLSLLLLLPLWSWQRGLNEAGSENKHLRGTHDASAFRFVSFLSRSLRSVRSLVRCALSLPHSLSSLAHSTRRRFVRSSFVLLFARCSPALSSFAFAATSLSLFSLAARLTSLKPEMSRHARSSV